jgi:hypothetical protein
MNFSKFKDEKRNSCIIQEQKQYFDRYSSMHFTIVSLSMGEFPKWMTSGQLLSYYIYWSNASLEVNENS